MNKYASMIQLAFGLAKAVEGQLPAGSGKDKLALSLSIGGLAFQQEEELRGAWGQPDKFASALSSTIGFAVAALNASGIFQKKTA